MHCSAVALATSRLLPPLVNAYLHGEASVSELTTHAPTPEGLAAAAAARANFSTAQRQNLVLALQQGYAEAGVPLTHLQAASLNALAQNALTVTTGHQLVLFGGPLYVLHKALSVCKMADALTLSGAAGAPVVPIFWLASEDHDWAEAASVQFFGKTLTATQGSTVYTGAVGRLPIGQVQLPWKALDGAIAPYPLAEGLRHELARAYTERDAAGAPRLWRHAALALLNELMAPYGGLVLEPDNATLKAAFAPIAYDELQHGTTARVLEAPLAAFARHFPVQANPRPVNLFALEAHARLRYHEPLGATPESALPPPESLSPNVLLRPLYQEVVLPNIAYVGGPGELAYWLQLRPLFAHYGVPMPVVALRNMALLAPAPLPRRTEKLGLELTDLLLPEAELQARIVQRHGGNTVPDLQTERGAIATQLHAASARASSLDGSLEGAAAAATARINKALARLERQMAAAHTRRFQNETDRAFALREVLLPNGTPKERSQAYAEALLQYGPQLATALYECFVPLPTAMLVVQPEYGTH